MKEVFLKLAIICILFCAILQGFSFCKKLYCILKHNSKTSCYKILQPDVRFLVGHIVSIIFGFYIIYDTYDTYQLALLYNIPNKSPDSIIIFLGIIIIISALFSIINEFFPTMVTSKYVCWKCQRVYQIENVEYYYDNDKIFIYFDGKTLFMNRREKYDSLIKILDTNYKRQEKT